MYISVSSHPIDYFSAYTLRFMNSYKKLQFLSLFEIFVWLRGLFFQLTLRIVMTVYNVTGSQSTWREYEWKSVGDQMALENTVQREALVGGGLPLLNPGIQLT